METNSVAQPSVSRKNGTETVGSQPSTTSKIEPGTRNEDCRKRNIVSESSYYGDTSVEAISAKVQEARPARRSSLKPVLETEVITTASAPQTGATDMKPQHRRNSGQKENGDTNKNRREVGTLILEGLMPSDATLTFQDTKDDDRVAKVAEPEEVVPSSQSTIVGVPASMSGTKRVESENRPEQELVKVLERLGKDNETNGSRKAQKAAGEQEIRQKTTSEQKTTPSKVNGEKMPVAEEPIITAAASASTKAVKHPLPKRAEKPVTPGKCNVTGVQYPCGRSSYYGGEGTKKVTKSSRGKLKVADDSIADVHEGFLLNENEIRRLLEQNHGEESKPKPKTTLDGPSQRGQGLPPRQPATVSRRIRQSVQLNDNIVESDGASKEPSPLRHRKSLQPLPGDEKGRKKDSQSKYRPASSPSQVEYQDTSRRRQTRYYRCYRDSSSDISRQGVKDEDKGMSRYSPGPSFREEMTSSTAHEGRWKGTRLLQERGRTKKNLHALDSDYSDGSGDRGEGWDEEDEDSGSWSYVSTKGSSSRKRAEQQNMGYTSDEEEATRSFSVMDYGHSSDKSFRSGPEVKRSSGPPTLDDVRKARRSGANRRSRSTMSRVMEDLPTASQLQQCGAVIAVFGGTNPDDYSNHMTGSAFLRYLPDDDVWEVCGQMPQPRSFHGVAYVSDRVYVVGGYGTDTTAQGDAVAAATCFRLDVFTMCWREMSPMRLGRACHALVTARGRLYVAGGKDHNGRITDSVETYDMEEDRWEHAPRLPRPLAAPAATFFQDRVWILGGIAQYSNGDCSTTKAVYQYDLNERRWFRQFELWTPLAYSLALTTDSGPDLWLWGGVGDREPSNSGEVRRWSPKHRAWEPRFTLDPPVRALCGASLEDRMYVIGGVTSGGGTATNRHVRYRSTERAPCLAAPFPVPVAGAAAVAIPGYSSRSKDVRPSEATDSDEAPNLKLRTVYRRYRQRRKLRGDDDDDDHSPARFPKTGVAESTRVLSSTFCDARVQKSDVSRETSPEFGTKEERLSLELRTPSRQSRRQKIVERDARLSRSPRLIDGYATLPSSVDPNLGLALILEDDKEQCGSRCSDTTLAIQSVRPCKTLPAKCAYTVLSFGGVDLSRTDCHEIGRLALYFHPLKNRWERLEPMPEPRNYHTAALVGDEVFIIGGHDPRVEQLEEMTSCSTTFCYSTASRTWSRRAAAPRARAFHACAVLKDRIYVIGGRDDSGRLVSSVDVYSPMMDAWTSFMDLPQCLMGAAATAFRDRLWILGGVTSSQKSFNGRPDLVVDNVLVVDVSERMYSDGVPLPFACAYAGVAATADKLWLCGGLSPADQRGRLKSVSSVYVLQEDQWVFYDVLALNRHALAAISFSDSFVLCFGGVTTTYEASVDDCELFYEGPGHGNLKVRPPPFALAGHSAVVLPPSTGRDSAFDPVAVWGRISVAAEAI